MGRTAKRPARDRICETARDLFYQRGIRGVGVELIAAEAGTTKMSLYRNFASKDELVAECLCEQDREFWKWWDELMEPLKGQPEKQIEALFDALRETCLSEGARGCHFANAAVELPDASHPGRQVVLNHHEKFRHRLREI
ncbi:MAG TPA: helix-turn-helix domain-containing protein, partial [Woeseiaceae bacterium]|nr:helix-turn-helix domain-containing protein [Woeseiaceae bacterium]